MGRKTSDSTAGQSHTRSRAIRTSVAGAPVVGARRGVIQDSTERRARRGLIRHMESEGVVPKKKKNMTTDVADLDSVPPVTFTNAAGRMYFCHDPTPEELAQAQEKVDREVPLAIAAFQEAQRARGVWSLRQAGWRRSLAQVGNLVALTVPAIVLTARRAWGMTEAAYARGFGAPHRRSFRQLAMTVLDWGLVSGATAVVAILIYWHWRLV